MKELVESEGSRSTSDMAETSAAPGPIVMPDGKRAVVEDHLAPIWARHRVVHLFMKLTIYYLAATAFVTAALMMFPGLSDYMPVGGAKSLIGDVSKDPFTAIETNAFQIQTLSGSVLWMAIAITGAVLTILPVSWTYMSIRKRSDYDQSLVETIIILPIAVTSLVLLVHDSLALAFSLGGIVAVVRFRNTLKSTGDALYILVAIGIGLSAGVGAMEVAIVMSLAFNYCFLILWITDYGSHRGTRRYMRRARKSLHGDKEDEDEGSGEAGDDE
jgi:hypothetical protein